MQFFSFVLLFYKLFSFVLMFFCYNLFMVVYVEQVIFDNAVFDTILLLAVGKTMRLRTKWHRIVIAVCIGIVCAFASVLPVWCIVAKVVCLPVMSIICNGFNKRLLLHILLSLAYTFLLGGVVLAILLVFNINYTVENGALVYNFNKPVMAYLLAIVLFVVIVFVVVNYIRSGKKVASFYKNVVLFLPNKVQLVGYIDSGDTLCVGNLPVCFVVSKNSNALDFVASGILHGKSQSVVTSTIGGVCTKQAVETQMEIDGIKQNILLAVAVQNGVDFDILLNASLLNDTKQTEGK